MKRQDYNERMTGEKEKQNIINICKYYERLKGIRERRSLGQLVFVNQDGDE